MEKLYDEMAIIKNTLDSFIKEGKTYYKGYKIYGEINFEPEKPLVIDGKEKDFRAESDWKLVFEDKKPLPKKVDALELWKNHNKESLAYPQVFISRVTHDFIYPKKKEIFRFHQNFIPYEIFEKASPKDFYYHITVVISKYQLPYKKLNSILTEYDNMEKRYSSKKRNLFGFEKQKILKIAKKMLDFEVEGNIIGKKIESDFETLAKKDLPFLEDFYVGKMIDYKFSHPFGIVTKKDILKSFRVNIMLTVSPMEISDNWIEFFWEKPYSDYHLTFLNHSLRVFDVAEIIRRKRPKAFFLENVKGLMIHDKGKTFETILNVLRNDLDYYVPDPEIVNAMNFGVPQHRERVYIVGFRKDLGVEEFAYPTPTDKTKTFADIKEEHEVSPKYYLSTQYLQTLIAHKERHASKGNGFGYAIVEDNEVANAIVVGGMGRERNLVRDDRLTDFTPVTNIKGEINRQGIRRMTPREWARLQGFPDDFIIGVADASAYKQFGNSVAVPAIQATAEKIISTLKF